MVRNYDSPDPKAVVRSVGQVLEKHDIDQLTKDAYRFVITHCGFIAHYALHGFRAEYRGHLDDFVEFFLQGGEVRLIDHSTGEPVDQWQVALDNHKSYLYDVSYRGVILADIIRELRALFIQWAPMVNTEEASRKRAGKELQLAALAREMGYELVKKGGE